MSKSILGTGLSGLVGSRLVDLYKNNYNFENLDLTTGVDITKEDVVEKAVAKSDANVLVHFAAFTDVNKAFEQADNTQGLCYKVNVIGTKNIAKACKKHNKYLIHISTDFIFDGTKEEPYTELDKPSPIEWYGKTKYLAEEEVKNSGTAFSILRLAYPYRASHPERVDMIRNTLKRLKDGNMYPPFSDHIITPTFIDDIANVVNIVISQKPESETFNLVGSSWHSDYEITKLIQEVFNLSGEIKEGSLEEYLKTSSRPYQKTMKISNQKLIDKLKYTPKTLKEGLEIIKKQMKI
ncbi:SDR family oxidoreductase [Patescibacteria group bacterium]